MSSVEPKCSYFGTCGGCIHQHLDYPAQLELKRTLVQTALADLDHFDVSEVQPTLASPKPFQYRLMLAMTVKRRYGTLRLGFMGRDGKSFLPIESCPIADERINQFLPEALRKLEALPEKRRFRTSQMVLRVGAEGEVLTSLRSDRGRTLECAVLGKGFSYSVSSFFQHNFSILDSFVRTIRDFLNPSGTVRMPGTLFDLYSGVGLLGISLADGYKQVIGIEDAYEAVEHARRNSERNGVHNAEFLEGNVEALLPKLVSDIERPFQVIIDPPRAGLKPEVIDCLLQMRPERLVYVSCSLESLRRDLSALKGGFRIARVQPLDFFPQTKHVETVLLLLPVKG